ncbi:MAG: Ig-like domain-containing protein [Bacteroidetes bacterium]|nr:Ig-like domain-containing protein [Bacteroidota bacterium]
MKKGFEYLFCIAALFLGACANIVTPSGGQKDITPPIVLKTTPYNFSKNFAGNSIKIGFNEYVKLTDMANQVMVSPFMKEMPEIKIKGKSIVVNFSDTLKPDNTYSISFGKSISDITENNVLRGYRYFFSTGNTIDSLYLKGIVRNAFTLKPENSVLVMLYNNLEDSVPYKEKPFYIAKTDDTGAFYFSNLKKGRYKIFSLKDANNNFIYDQPSEKIAFIDSLITPIPIDTAKADSLKKQTIYCLNLFEEAPSKQKLLKSYSEKYGKLVLIFRKPVENLILEPLNKNMPSSWNIKEENKTKDSITIWLKNPEIDTLFLKVTDNNEILDTSKITLIKKSIVTKTGKGRGEDLRYISFILNASKNSTFGFYKPLLIDCLSPISDYSFNKIILTENKDTIKPIFFFTDSIHRVIRSDYKWKENANYSLFIPPVALKNMFGIANDTLKVDFKTNSLKDYGNLKLKIIAKELNCNLIVQLLTENNAVVNQKIIISNDKGKVQFDYILPGNYKLKVICDENKNNIWDTGNYLKKFVPEKVFYNTSIINVKANWDLDFDWVLE